MISLTLWRSQGEQGGIEIILTFVSETSEALVGAKSIGYGDECYILGIEISFGSIFKVSVVHLINLPKILHPNDFASNDGYDP